MKYQLNNNDLWNVQDAIFLMPTEYALKLLIPVSKNEFLMEDFLVLIESLMYTGNNELANKKWCFSVLVSIMGVINNHLKIFSV